MPNLLRACEAIQLIVFLQYNLIMIITKDLSTDTILIEKK